MNKLASIVILVFAFASFAQNDSKAVLIDEFSQIHCDEFLARVDNFYIQLNASSGSTGYFVITGAKEFLTKKLKVELLFESAVKTRGHDRVRTSIIRGTESGPFEVKMWIGMGDSPTPDFGETNWDLRFPPESVPFDLRSDMAQICDPPPIGRVAHDLMLANPDGSIFVIVHGRTVKQWKMELNAARKMLTGFSQSRIRYLLRKSTYAYSDYYFATGKPKRSDFKSYF